MVKKILTILDNNQALRQKSQEVTTFDKSVEILIGDLLNTIDAQIDPIGLGLSAPQIGVFKRVFVARIRNKLKSFVNPKITSF